MKNVKIGFIGGGNMGGAMIEALWRAQSDEADAGRSSAEGERKFSGGSETQRAENLAQTDKNASRRECEKEAKFEILACAKGDGEGCFYLGELYKNNLAKAADKSERETKISAYYKASCVLYEYLPGCLALANFMQEELGDEVQSFAINNTLCNKKYAPGCYNVGWMIERTGGDIGEMMEYYERSCKLGYVGGCARAAWLYEGNFNENRYVQVKKDAKKAKQMRKKACELGDKQSC